VAAQAGWYPDPGGGPGLYRYWDGRAWSAATSPHPNGSPPAQGLVGASSKPSQPYGQLGSTPPHGGTSAYANYQQVQQKKSPVGWWIVGSALVVVIVVVAVIAIRAVTNGNGGVLGTPVGQPSQDVCPAAKSPTTESSPAPADGRVHGGPLSFPMLGSPWNSPNVDNRVPFGSDVRKQEYPVEVFYQPGQSWVASVLVGELQAGDGFFTPEQGSQIVVKCILGRFYGNNPVTSDVQVNEKTTVEGHDAWVVESELSFDIPGLRTKGELLIVVIVATDTRSGIYYASIPDTVPELVKPARQALADLRVDG
jgi:hypothetical protein